MTFYADIIGNPTTHTEHRNRAITTGTHDCAGDDETNA